MTIGLLSISIPFTQILSGWLEAQLCTKVEWKCMLMEAGALSVMTSGVLKTQMLCAINWDMEWVSILGVCLQCNVLILALLTDLDLLWKLIKWSYSGLKIVCMIYGFNGFPLNYIQQPVLQY